MAGQLRQAKAAATRAKVLAAAKALFERGGYEAATIRAIAAEAGCSTGAFFVHWPDKAAAYRELYGHAPVTPELGRALLLAARPALNESGPFVARLAAVVAQAEEA